jgi:hypothetical protein
VPRSMFTRPDTLNSQSSFRIERPRTPLRFRASTSIVLGLSGLAVLTGCAPIANVQSADDAGNPLCAEMMVVLPPEVAEQQKRQTNSQGTAVWGDPAQLVLRCGVTAPPPSTDPCVSVNGVDWLAKEGEDAWTLTTYGRAPATELVFDPNVIPSSTVLATLSSAASKIPAERGCTTVSKTVDVP